MPRIWGPCSRYCLPCERPDACGFRRGACNIPPLPCTRGRGVGGEGVGRGRPLTPDPSPPSTGERGGLFLPVAFLQYYIFICHSPRPPSCLLQFSIRPKN